jgi:Tfp pilus assembly protein PilO
MNEVREYRIPLLIGAGALVVAIIIWAAFISPQNAKLSSLQTQETQLQGQQTALTAKIAALKQEKQQLSSSCAEVQKIATEIPSVASPADLAAEESSFENQFNTLATASGVNLTQFSGFGTATTAGSSSSGSSSSSSSSGSSAATIPGVTPVPTTLTVNGNYGQMMAFVNGLESFPRLFVIQTFNLAISSGASGAGGSPSTSGSAGSGGSGPSAVPLWTGGQATSPSAPNYALSITGSIYYTSSANALAACTKAATLG